MGEPEGRQARSRVEEERTLLPDDGGVARRVGRPERVVVAEGEERPHFETDGRGSLPDELPRDGEGLLTVGEEEAPAKPDASRLVLPDRERVGPECAQVDPQ